MNILLIEDNPVEVKIIQSVLTKATNPSFEIECHNNLGDGIGRLDQSGVDLILLDLSLPDSAGLETFLKVQQKTPHLPIVVLTGLDNENVALEALRCGAQDYLAKGDADPKMLLRVIRYAYERKKIEQELKESNEKLERDEVELTKTLGSLKRSNEELKRTRLQLIQAAKMEVVGRLAAGVAHEVKNPLAMVRMGIDFFSNEFKEASEQGKFMLQSMRDAVKRADTVIKEMLDFSSLSELQMKSENISAVIDRSLFLVSHELSKANVNIIKEYNEDIPSVPLDRNRIEQILINIFDNAIRAMKREGDLIIRTSMEKMEKPGGIVGYRTSDIFAPGDSVAIIEVDDTGPGIPEEILDKVFDPFFTTRRGEGGTGLGLSVVKSIMQLHQGYIGMENREEGGAHVKMMFKL